MAAIEGEQKNIPIKGIIRAGSDNLCVDGSMNEVIGMEYKDGSYVPYAGHDVLSITRTDFVKLWIHKTTKQDNTIGLTDTNKLYWRKSKGFIIGNEQNKWIEIASDVHDIELLGDVLCVNIVNSGVKAYSFDGDNYICNTEGNILTKRAVEFRVTNGISEAPYASCGMQTIKCEEYGKYSSPGIIEDAWSDIVSATCDKTLGASLITKNIGLIRDYGGLQGFVLVCYAYRLNSGDLVYASNPVLLQATGWLQKDKFCTSANSTTKYETGYMNPYCYCDGKEYDNNGFINSNSFEIGDFNDRTLGFYGLYTSTISGISDVLREEMDVEEIAKTTEGDFVDDERAPLHKTNFSDTRPSFTDIAETTGKYYHYSSRLYEGTDYTEMMRPLIPFGCSWIGMSFDTHKTSSNECAYITQASKFISSRLQLKINKDIELPSNVSSICIFISPQVYPFYDTTIESNVIAHGPFLNGYFYNSSTNSEAEHTVGSIVYSFTPRLRSEKDIKEEIMNIPGMYKVKEIYKEELSNYQDGFVEVSLKGLLGETLLTLEQLPSTAFDYSKIYANIMGSYNYKIHLANIKSKLYEGYALPMLLHNYESYRTIEGTEHKLIHAETIVTLSDDSNSDNHVVVMEKKGYAQNIKGFGPILSYPDIRAKQMVLITQIQNGEETLTTLNTYNLIPLNHIGISVFINNGLKPITKQDYKTYNGEDAFSIYSSFNNEITQKNKLRVSDTANPTYYPSKYTYTVGDGEIIGFGRLSIALSQDNYGRVPLLVFCTDGIYAMEVDMSGGGAYISSSAFSREVCINKNSICEIDNAVLFVSKKGLMIATQEGVQEFIPQLNGTPNFVPVYKKDILDEIKCDYGAAIYHKLVNSCSSDLGGNNGKIVDLYNAIDEVDFMEYISDSDTYISYVNIKNKILIYNKNKNYVYWIDIQSRITTKLSYSICYSDNNYPNEIYYLKSNEVIRPSLSFGYKSKDANVDCLLQSRPIKIQQGSKSSLRVVLTGYFNNTIADNRSITYSGEKEKDVEYIKFDIDEDKFNAIRELTFSADREYWVSDKGVLFSTTDIILTGSSGAYPISIYPSDGDKIIIRAETTFAELVVLGSLDGKHWQPIGIQEKELLGGFHNFGCVTERVSCNYIMILFAGKLSSDSHIDSIDVQVEGKYNNKLKV